MPNASKNKGNSFEREIAKYLTNFYGESFTRVQNSGAMIGGLNNHRINTLSANQIRIFKGDIIPPESFSKLVIEAKFYADFPFHKFLINNEPINQIETWITQAKDCCEKGDIWLLAIKINRKGTYILWNDWTTKIPDAGTVGIPYNHQYRITDIDSFFNNLGNYLKKKCRRGL